ncbi:UNVERIFIED_CONTAM: hypothetical protein HDU68_001715 [Siphonaria sp. JEL0065]|nr:hypothetical protein HDU68_001715 [Siphonaria sp. JEL0065]
MTDKPPPKKKGRGLANDEGHVDKRRVQIRLAQRAFRERKEIRIRELEQQVKELETQAKQSSASNVTPDCQSCHAMTLRIAELEVKLEGPSASSHIHTHQQQQQQWQWQPPRFDPMQSPQPPFHVTNSQQNQQFQQQRIGSSLSSPIRMNQYSYELQLPHQGGSWFAKPADQLYEKNRTETTAASQFGMPSLESGRLALKQIVSLRDSPYVDELFDTFLVSCSTSDKKEIRRYMIKYIWAKYKVFDQCVGNEQELKRVIELTEATRTLNSQHVAFVHEAASGKSPTEVMLQFARLGSLPNGSSSIGGLSRNEILRESNDFLQSVRQIPSLSKHIGLAEELCILFWTQAQSTQKEERENLFFQMLQVSNSLLDLCGKPEDRVQFLMATEVARQTNLVASDSMFEI